MSKIENRPARIRGIHRYHYRAGEWADLIGVEMVTPNISGSGVSLAERAAFVCKYDDGHIDYIPISDLQYCEIEAITLLNQPV